MAVLNVSLNVEKVDVGEKFKEFRDETERMSSPVRCPCTHPLTHHLNFVVVCKGFVGFECPSSSLGTQRTRSVSYHLPRSLSIP